MRTLKKHEDIIDITLCKTPVGKIVFILKRLLGYEMQELLIEMPRSFLVNTSEHVRHQLIGKSIKISITNDDDEVVLKHVVLHISHKHSDYIKLFNEIIHKDLKDFTTDTISFNITIDDTVLISKLIAYTKPYELKVKTI